MRRCLLVAVLMFALAPWSPAQALESGATCDIEDDADQPDALEELERILKALSTETG